MLNRKTIDDWASPKPVTERHSSLKHMSGHPMRKGDSKFDPDLGPSSDVFWATIKTQAYDKGVPFGSISNDLTSNLSQKGREDKIGYRSQTTNAPERSRDDTISYRSQFSGKRHNPLDNITDRHLLHGLMDDKSLQLNDNLGLKEKDEQQHINQLDVRNGGVSSNYHVLESRRHLHDIDKRIISSRSSGSSLAASSHYSIGTKEYSSMESTSHASLSKISSVPSAMSLTPVTSRESVDSNISGKWDQVINAKDNLIQKKDNIIERQKQTIEQLQSHIIVIEERINQNSLKLAAQSKEEEKSKDKLSSSEHQISLLKAQLQHVNASKQDEIERLQKKLGETEYELQKLEKGCKDVGKEQAREIAELKQKIEERDQLERKLKSSFETVQNTLKDERRKAQNLKQYLQDLPTAEEHTKTLQQIKEAKLEKSALEERIEHLEHRLKDSKRHIRQKDVKLEEERQLKESMENEIRKLTDQIDRYKEREMLGPISMEEFDEVKWENERVKADCERLQKLMEQKHRKMKTLHEQSQSTVKALEEHLAQEENTVNVLRKELEGREVAINDIKASMKQIQDKNQELMRENLALRDILEELETLTSAEVHDAHNQVQKELACCVSEINFLIDLCSEIAEGKDPNMSALLGIKGNSEIEIEGTTSNPFSAEAAKLTLSKIRKLRSEIDKLRTFVSDKYAEDVGNNCITQ